MKTVDPRFSAWLLEETGIEAESLGAHALARAVASRAAAMIAAMLAASEGGEGGNASAHGHASHHGGHRSVHHHGHHNAHHDSHRASHRGHAHAAPVQPPVPAQWEGGLALPDKVRDAYWTYLTTAPAERQALIDALVVPETWFFREREAFTALARIGAEHLTKHPGEVLRVLSVPCSTGEEPYSAAMALLDAGLSHAQFGIDALDISAASIEAAARAVYGRNAFRGDALSFRERYFHAGPDGWRLADTVRRAVHFERANLFEWLAAHPVRYDFIFCRNVLIYFDRAAQDRAIGLLRGRLADGGMIFVGPAETGLMMRHEFQSAYIPLAFGFRVPEAARADGEAAGPQALASSLAVGCLPGASVTANARAPVASAPGAVPPAALRPLHAAPPARAAGFVGVVPGAASAPAAAFSARAGAPLNGFSPGVTPTQNTAPLAPFTALSTRTQPSAPTPDAALREARRLADAGALDDAQRLATQAAQAAPHDAPTWYLLGLIADAQGNGALAQEHYRKAVYLEPGHYEALTHLAALLEVQGDAEGARRLMRRAERAAQRAPDRGGADA
ncbi:CheR family methyltransferase [Paraburkholderia tropica]|uniref:CheR family methyltransferase n=1 Tax=Paraburkholderia tropica TaxID=92647 RepID=UPI001FC7F797|nr:protein-glutamate O-methyltransferase CheR [Paraburkholderia tropica]